MNISPRPSLLVAQTLIIACALAGGATRAADPGHAEPTKKAAHEAMAPASAAVPKPAEPLQAVREMIALRLGAKLQGQEGNVTLRVPARSAAAVAPSGHAAPPIKNVVQRRSHGTAGASAGAASAEHTHWSYDGDHGPQAWGQIKPEFLKCATGSRQSPIDIRDGIGVDLEPIRFNYQSSAFGVIDNGHTVQVNVAPGNSIEVIGRRYDLIQFHFHRPSEERVNGRQFDMVAHLVHKDLEGRLAVVAVLLDRGGAQALVQTIWNNLPLEKGEELPARARIDLNHLLPVDRRYYTYMGSLTTPPCSESVLWMVMQQPMSMSAEQIDIFGRLYPMNARPIQSAAGRLIKQSN